MPTHAYRSDRRPPTFTDHVLAHCFELTISLWAMLGGLAAIFSAFNDRATVSPSLDSLPNVLAAVAGVLLLAGGAGIVRGLFDDSDDLMVGFRYERMGLVLSAAGWLSYGSTILFLAIVSALSWSLCLFLAIACSLRFVATKRSEQQIRRAIR